MPRRRVPGVLTATRNSYPAHNRMIGTTPATGSARNASRGRVGGLDRFLWYWLRSSFQLVVTWREQLGRFTLGFRSIAGTRSWPSPGLGPARRCPITTATPSTALVTIQPAFTDPERLALAGFLAGYRGLTREATALDRNELGALLVAAGLGPPPEHALISLLALNGLRVSEATGPDIEHLGLERGHRTLTITRKGGTVVTIPLAPRTARAIDLATGERCDGPLFLTADGRRLDRHGAGRIVRKLPRRAGIAKPVGPHTLRHAFITSLDAGVPLRDVQEAASHADP